MYKYIYRKTFFPFKFTILNWLGNTTKVLGNKEVNTSNIFRVRKVVKA